MGGGCCLTPPTATTYPRRRRSFFFLSRPPPPLADRCGDGGGGERGEARSPPDRAVAATGRLALCRERGGGRGAGGCRPRGGWGCGGAGGAAVRPLARPPTRRAGSPLCALAGLAVVVWAGLGRVAAAIATRTATAPPPPTHSVALLRGQPPQPGRPLVMGSGGGWGVTALAGGVGCGGRCFPAGGSGWPVLAAPPRARPRGRDGAGQPVVRCVGGRRVPAANAVWGGLGERPRTGVSVFSPRDAAVIFPVRGGR